MQGLGVQMWDKGAKEMLYKYNFHGTVIYNYKKEVGKI